MPSGQACIGAKAAQSRMLFIFSHWTLKQRLPFLKKHIAEDEFKRGKGLLAASEALLEWYRIVKSHGVRIPMPECQRALGLATKHNSLCSRHSNYSCKPKHHGLVEMTKAMPFSGNPAFSSTYNDESLNSVIARIARSVHPKNFTIEVLCKYFLLRSLNDIRF